MTVTLSPDVIALIEARMNAHGYPSADELVRDALRLMDGDYSIENDPDALRALLQEGLDSGEPLEVEADDLESHIIHGTPLRSR